MVFCGVQKMKHVRKSVFVLLSIVVFVLYLSKGQNELAKHGTKASASPMDEEIAILDISDPESIILRSSQKSETKDKLVLSVEYAANYAVPSIADLVRQINMNPDCPEVVVTVFDVEYAAIFGNFVAMCQAHGLLNVVGLALSSDAATLAALDVLSSEIMFPDHVRVLYDSNIEQYIAETGGKARWHRIGHSKLILNLAGLEAGYRIFVIEIDVILLRKPSLKMPNIEEYDVISMYCPTTRHANNRINLGFQLWQPSNSSVNFLWGVTREAVESQAWDQGVQNTHYNNGGENKPVKLAPLHICIPDPDWRNSPEELVTKVYEMGSAMRSLQSISHTAIHVIGIHTLSKIEWMSQAHVLEIPPYGEESFVMLEGSFRTREEYSQAAHDLFGLGESLGRIPILPPGSPGHSLPHQLIDIEKLRSCGGGFKMAPFLNGHPFLNKTEAPTDFYFCDANSTNFDQLPKAGVLVVTTQAEHGVIGRCNVDPIHLSEEDRIGLSTRGLRPKSQASPSWTESYLGTILHHHNRNVSTIEETLACVRRATQDGS